MIKYEDFPKIFRKEEVIRNFKSEKEFTNRTIKMIKEKRIVRIRNGLFALIDYAGNILASRFEIASKINEDSFISYHSALEYYNLVNQCFNYIYVSSFNKFNNFEYENGNYIYLKTDYLDEVNTIPLKLIKVISIERTIIDSIKRIDLAGGIEDLLIALDTVYSLNEDVLFKVLKHYNEVYLYQKVAYLLSLFKEKLHISENFFNECKSHFTNQIKYFLNESIENIVYFKEWKLMASKDLKKC